MRPQDVARIRTIITNFMHDAKTTENQTLGDLRKTYDKALEKSWGPDLSNDYRIQRFVQDIRNGAWTGNIDLTIRNDVLVDGVHRGIAYLIAADTVPHAQLPSVKLH